MFSNFSSTKIESSPIKNCQIYFRKHKMYGWKLFWKSKCSVSDYVSIERFLMQSSLFYIFLLSGVGIAAILSFFPDIQHTLFRQNESSKVEHPKLPKHSPVLCHMVGDSVHTTDNKYQGQTSLTPTLKSKEKLSGKLKPIA